VISVTYSFIAISANVRVFFFNVEKAYPSHTQLFAEFERPLCKQMMNPHITPNTPELDIVYILAKNNFT
jgi:hypothetical protein